MENIWDRNDFSVSVSLLRYLDVGIMSGVGGEQETPALTDQQGGRVNEEKKETNESFENIIGEVAGKKEARSNQRVILILPLSVWVLLLIRCETIFQTHALCRFNTRCGSKGLINVLFSFGIMCLLRSIQL